MGESGRGTNLRESSQQQPTSPPPPPSQAEEVPGPPPLRREGRPARLPPGSLRHEVQCSPIESVWSKDSDEKVNGFVLQHVYRPYLQIAAADWILGGVAASADVVRAVLANADEATDAVGGHEVILTSAYILCSAGPFPHLRFHVHCPCSRVPPSKIPLRFLFHISHHQPSISAVCYHLRTGTVRPERSLRSRIYIFRTGLCDSGAISS